MPQKADSVHQEGWPDWNRKIACSTWRLILLDFSEGLPISMLARRAPDMFDALQRSVLSLSPQHTSTYHLTEKNTYSWFLSLFTFAKLLRHDEYLPRLVALLDLAQQDNQGKDQLYELLFKKMDLRSVPAQDCIQHATCYPLLVKVIEAEPSKRPRLMRTFLKKWYPDMHGVTWHNTHKTCPHSYPGYWCWEAALVTYLWEIDDSSYCDMAYYPKHLVAWARNLDALSEQNTSREAMAAHAQQSLAALAANAPEQTCIENIHADDWAYLRNIFLPAFGWQRRKKSGGMDHSYGFLTKGSLTIEMEYETWSEGWLTFAKSDQEALLAELPADFVQTYFRR